MNKNLFFLILFLTVVATLLGYNYFFQPFADKTEKQVESVSLPDSIEEELAVPEQEKNLWKLFAVPVTLPADEELIDWVSEKKPGVVTIFGENIEKSKAKEFTEKIKTISPNTKVAVDHEGGEVQRLTGIAYTRLPSWQELCSEENLDSGKLLASSSAELAESKIDYVLAPMVDVGDSRVLGSRICSGDPELVLRKASEYVEAMQAVGVKPVLKHFPGIGSIDKDLHEEFDSVTITAKDASPFVELLSSYADLAVMVSHAGVNNQYAEIPCSLSKTCVAELTSNFPNTLVFTDALDMAAAAKTSESIPPSLDQISIRALEAGNDILLYGPGVDTSQLETIYMAIKTRYENNASFRKTVDGSLEKAR